MTTTDRNPRAWAQRIVDRYDQGDRSMGNYAYRQAVEVMENLSAHKTDLSEQATAAHPSPPAGPQELRRIVERTIAMGRLARAPRRV